MAPRALKRTGIVAGVAAGAVGIAYADRAGPRGRACATATDPDAGLPARPRVRRHAPPRQPRRRHHLHHLRGATGPPVVFCHGVTLSSRVWVKQFDVAPGRGVPGGRVRLTAATASRRPARPAHSIDNLADDVRTVRRGPRPARRGARRALDGRDRGAGLRHPSPGRRARARAPGIVLLRPLSRTLLSGARRLREALDRLVGRRSRPRRVHARPATSGSCWRASVSATTPSPSHVEADPRRCSRRARRDDDTARAGAALLGLDLTEELPSIDVPTLVLVGTADVLTPPARVAPYRRPDPRCPAGRVRRCRSHAHARAHRRRSTALIMRLRPRVPGRRDGGLDEAPPPGRLR